MRETFKTTSSLEVNLDDGFTQIGKLFDDLESEYAKLSDMLGGGRWTGVSSLQCKDIHALLAAYEQAIRPLVISFKGDCSWLLNSIDSFCPESLVVSGLRRG